MTAYNRQKFIAEAIESVLTQTYQNWELIIVDDCSKDNTVNIAESYAQKDERVRVYINETNLGDYPNRNVAASYAKGEYIMYVDSDDTINCDALSYVVNYFLAFPDAQHSTISYDKKVTTPLLMNCELAIRNHFYVNNMLATGPGARVFRRDFYFEMGGYPVKYGPANDMYFNIKTASSSPILALPYVYLNYRRHEGQEINNQYPYLYHGYRYFQDAIKMPIIPISSEEKTLLIKKSKRRFVVNLIKYFKKEKNISKSIAAIRLARFTFRDLIQALIH
jgi:glycosyltransferase involved in cell wall biosynthesis